VTVKDIERQTESVAFEPEEFVRLRQHFLFPVNQTGHTAVDDHLQRVLRDLDVGLDAGEVEGRDPLLLLIGPLRVGRADLEDVSWLIAPRGRVIRWVATAHPVRVVVDVSAVAAQFEVRTAHLTRMVLQVTHQRMVQVAARRSWRTNTRHRRHPPPDVLAPDGGRQLTGQIRLRRAQRVDLGGLAHVPA